MNKTTWYIQKRRRKRSSNKLAIAHMLINPIEVTEYLCAHSRIMCQCAESSSDIIAAIRGICAAFGDLSSEMCLGDFPIFVQRNTSSEDGESWLDTLRRQCRGNNSRETLDVIQGLLRSWKDSHPIIPDDVLLNTGSVLDKETVDFLEDTFRRPTIYVPGASTIRELLSFTGAYIFIYWPPHGCSPCLFEKMDEKACKRFNRPPGVTNMEFVLANELSNVPFAEACQYVANLIKECRE